MIIKSKRYFVIPLLLVLVFLLTAGITENLLLSRTFRHKDINGFSQVLHRKQDHLDRIMTDIHKKLDLLPDNFDQLLFELFKDYNQLFDKEELSILITRDNRPVYWTDQVAAFTDNILSAPTGLIKLENGWYLLSRQEIGPYIIHGVILIKYSYQISNDYLRNRFARGFNLPDDFEILFYNSEYVHPVFDTNNRFLFSISPSDATTTRYSDLYFPVALYLLALFSLFVFLYRINNHLFHRHSIAKQVILFAFLVGLYLFMNHFRLPRSLFQLELFSPHQFACSKYWTSLGEFVFFSLLMLFWSVNFFRSFNLPVQIRHKSLNRIIGLSIGIGLSAAWLIMVRHLIAVLILNSSISYAVYQISDMDPYSVAGFLAIGMILIAFLLFNFRITQIFRKETGTRHFFLIVLFFSGLLLLYFIKVAPGECWYLTLFFIILNAMGYLISRFGILNHRLSVIIAYVVIFTLLTLTMLLRLVDQDNKRMQKLMVVNLAEEHDPIAELYLIDIDQQIKADTILPSLLDHQYHEVSQYLEMKYFSGYFRNYDFQATVCEAGDSLTIRPTFESSPCFPFFDQSIDNRGMTLASTQFYHVGNMNGRITYLGRYQWEFEHRPVRIYIELNSKMLSEGAGFPELLLPQHSIESRIRNHFSFAKYNHGELVDRGGEFLYTLNTEAYHLSDEQIGFRSWDGYEHCIWNQGDRDYIIVSRPKIKLYDYFISFPYIFVFFFILASILNILTRPKIELTLIGKSLRAKIQITIVGVVFITLLLVGGGTITFNIWQYRANHQQDLVDKINSISVEMDLLMAQIDDFGELDTDFLNLELLRISDVFRIDINLFDLNGRLQASSRPEVFEKGLISEYMDNTAIRYLSLYQPTRYIHREHIGKLNYLSAYVPLINRSGKNFGYIHIPYFTHERKFRQQITTFVLAFVNIYVFLLMGSILVAFYLSGRITDPLKLIRDNLRKMQLGKNTQPIRYRSDDEIGLLVAEYNNKLDELANSAELLARTEREMAWREMAKQIAHEIKNPLTPMKLNIQFLQRTSQQPGPDFQSKLNRVTETLIEQIDNLSAIASAFSNFAQMPNAKNETFDLARRLKETIDLYEHTGQVDLITRIETRDKLLVHADKEQFSRAIINLVRNAIQSIPDDRPGKIEILLNREGQFGTIAITDNGKGIDDALHESIFMPNFTTKTSGTGLGLAITKNIVQNFRGEIWFESKAGYGTTFYIKIPLIS